MYNTARIEMIYVVSSFRIIPQLHEYVIYGSLYVCVCRSKWNSKYFEGI